MHRPWACYQIAADDAKTTFTNIFNVGTTLQMFANMPQPLDKNPVWGDFEATQVPPRRRVSDEEGTCPRPSYLPTGLDAERTNSAVNCIAARIGWFATMCCRAFQRAAIRRQSLQRKFLGASADSESHCEER